jgi:hypothetical protein
LFCSQIIQMNKMIIISAIAPMAYVSIFILLGIIP